MQELSGGEVLSVEQILNKNQALLAAANVNAINDLKVLLLDGVNVDYQDDLGKTALHYAVIAANMVNSETHRGARNFESALSCIQLLLDYDAAELQDNAGKLPRDYVYRRSEIIDLLDSRKNDIAIEGDDNPLQVRSSSKLKLS